MTGIAGAWAAPARCPACPPADVLDDGSLIWIEVVLGFVIPVGWGLWQLAELRRLKRRDDEAARTGTPPPDAR